MKDAESNHRNSDPPGAVSNQNQEEGPSALRDDETHPEPRTAGKHRRRRGKRADPEGHEEQED